jgi:hypothetical protein
MGNKDYFEKIAIGILNYNKSEMTDKFFYDLSAINDGYADIYVIDNGSDNPPKSTTHFIKRNLGYTNGYNFWLKDLYKHNKFYKAYVLSNNDMSIINKDILKLINFYLDDEKEIGCLSPVIDGSTSQFMKKDESFKGALREVLYTDGMFMIIRNEVLKKQPFLDKRMSVGYGVDVDYGIISNNNGFKNFVMNNVLIQHLGHGTFYKNNVFSKYKFFIWRKKGMVQAHIFLFLKYGIKYKRYINNI